MDVKEHGVVAQVNAEEHKALAPGICIDTEKCLGKEYWDKIMFYFNFCNYLIS